jgi:peptidoglycan/LPS O-acetylase OafA/YrhL
MSAATSSADALPTDATGGPAFAKAPVLAGKLLNPVQSDYLDVVRGGAAQLVLLQHASVYFLPQSGMDRLGLGALGVMVFFLLSGFLITDTIASRISTGGFSLSEFMISRFSRIYTAYVPAIILVAVVDHFAVRTSAYDYRATYNAPTAIANLFMLQDFPVFQILRRLHVPAQAWFFKSFGSAGQLWTVSIEWWIYVLAGIGTYLMLRAERLTAPLVLLCGLALIEPGYHLVAGPGDCLTAQWLLGGVAAALYRRQVRAGLSDRTRRMIPVALLVVTGLAATRLAFNGLRIYDAVLAALVAALVFLPLLQFADGRRRWWERLGLHRSAFHSYSLYLTHLPLLYCFWCYFGAAFEGWRGLLIVIVATNLFAIPFALLFERPHRAVRRHLLRLAGAARERTRLRLGGTAMRGHA